MLMLLILLTQTQMAQLGCIRNEVTRLQCHETRTNLYLFCKSSA
jgi:hypothetical protein